MENNNEQVVEIVEPENEIVENEKDIDTLSFALALISWIPDTFRKITNSEDDIDFVYFAIGVSMILMAIRAKNNRIKR